MIQFSHVSKYYSPNKIILNNISFFINKGEFVCLTGPSGSGKSTIFRLIIMEEFPNSGEVTIMRYKSTNISHKRMAELRQGLGIIFQDFKLLYDRSVFENIAFPLRLHCIDQKHVKERVFKTVTEIGLNHKMYDFPKTLSASEKQKCCIARALINNPSVLLADEPTGYLDTESSSDIINLLKQINRHGTAILLGTHNYEMATNIKERTLILKEGIITNQNSR
ncbi:MAG: ATP-binding cassette domain-containing protein [Elusimicrobiota bacterium]